MHSARHAHMFVQRLCEADQVALAQLSELAVSSRAETIPYRMQ